MEGFVFITRRIVAPSGAMTILGSNSTNGSRSTSGNGTTGSGGTTGGGRVRASSNMQGPLFAFNLVVDFLVSYNKITKGLIFKSCKVCRISNVSPMKACKKSMHVCVG
jgi:hypothetical protein